MPLPHYPGNGNKDIKSLEKVYQVSENIHKLAKAGGKKISVEENNYHAFRLGDDEVMMVKKFGELDPYLSVKFLKGVFREDKKDDISFFCEEGTIYLEYSINKELSIWGLSLREKSYTYKYGVEFKNIKPTISGNKTTKFILEKITEIQRSERIKIILG